jgi:hypothetical protein
MAAGISTKRQARYQRRMSSLLAANQVTMPMIPFWVGIT